MTEWQAVVLGIVEGISEFLPISSTGHLILTAHILGIKHTDFVKSFEISIQLGSILAVVVLYFNRLIRDYEIWKRIIAAFIPTGIIGFLLYKLIKGFLIGNDLVVVVSLILGGIILIFADTYCEKFCYLGDVRELPLRKAFMIGVFQSIAVIPGVSRSGSTIIGGMLMGLNRKVAAEFSFLLAIPTMFAATTYDLIKSGGSFNAQEWNILIIGFITSFITALIVVKWFLNFLKSHSLKIFGFYRILIGLVYAAFFLF
ncbi:undecaprenyl-diphosphatase UppP [Aquifex aeolicus]|uniref:Undecaprenyl-diphosphatase n=1 Tax=Aquifex aeolicus (strain VF5) TaxID=224324 RepID=UPPP_AQUAE|nr:undecaprenyl-diphosphatase UppP [Aquifex aeolicus]O67939.1 RecName: Full=Undecaprenyl-diphosphatase; AltName: Full=Bacitracin resistance protein; AltName: Full=Undecaprenyl pyrophosphate phosphatase [Aquifex aeolicus VF5]AAC07896.1 undecaprenol kinase [Aquifex aeolicus VF5]